MRETGALDGDRATTGTALDQSTDHVSAATAMWLLLDHHNIPFNRVPLRTILEGWLTAVPSLPAGVVDVTLRAYGGWFRDATTTDARFRAAEFYQENCPTLLRLNDRYFRMRFEFADHVLALKQRPALQISHTVVTRAQRQLLRVRPDAPRCSEASCELRRLRSWLRKRRACTLSTCPYEHAAYFERLEQKQVDVHLAVDAITAADLLGANEHLAIASDDADIIPAAAGVVQRLKDSQTLALLRFDRSSAYLDSELRRHHVRIVPLLG